MKLKKLICQSLSIYSSDCFRVEKIKGVNSLCVYFNEDFVTGTVIKRLLSIDGLYFVGVNTEDKYLLFNY